MKKIGIFGGAARFLLTLLAGSLLIVLPEASFAASMSRDAAFIVGRSALSPDQRAVQAISRLTFGARPGDFERVRKMGVDAFIREQLNPDNIDDSALQKRLDKLPTPATGHPLAASRPSNRRAAPRPKSAALPTDVWRKSVRWMMFPCCWRHCGTRTN